MKNDLILMAEIVGVHGIRGTVKLKVFTDNPESLVDYAPFSDAKGQKTYDIEQLHLHGNVYLADLEGVADRTAAEKLRGVKLYAPRERLPDIKDKETYYHVDLVGLAAEHVDGTPMGTVIAVANFGAGDLLDIKPAKGNSFYIPFTNDAVPNVDLASKKIVIDPPPGLLD